MKTAAKPAAKRNGLFFSGGGELRDQTTGVASKNAIVGKLSGLAAAHS